MSDKFHSRTDTASDIINGNDSVSRTLSHLVNFFYDVAWPLELHERGGEKVTLETLNEEITARYKERSPEYRIEENLQFLGQYGSGSLEIKEAALQGVFAVAAERLNKDGEIIGNGHHARQEAAAEAVVRIDRLLTKRP